MNENAGKLYGYIRVSTKEQNEDRQRLAMHEFGIADRDIYMDKQSGKDFERPNYKRLIRKLKPGDTLVIKSIDQLGRNYEEILEQWHIITREKKSRYCCSGHAAAGYKTRTRPHRNLDRRHRPPASELCGANRTGVHSSAAGGRNRRRKSERRTYGKISDGNTGKLYAGV